MLGCQLMLARLGRQRFASSFDCVRSSACPSRRIRIARWLGISTSTTLLARSSAPILYLASACKLAVISDTRCMMDNARRSYRLLDGAIFLPLPGMSAGTWDASARWTFGRGRRAWLAGSTVQPAPIHRRLDRSDIAMRYGRNVRGSSPSTSVTLLESGHHS